MTILKIKSALHRNIFLLGVVFLGSCTGIMGNVAARHTKGLVSDGMFKFSMDLTSISYWVVFGVCILLALAAVWALVLSLISHLEQRAYRARQDQPRSITK